LEFWKKGGNRSIEVSLKESEVFLCIPIPVRTRLQKAKMEDAVKELMAMMKTEMKEEMKASQEEIKPSQDTKLEEIKASQNQKFDDINHGPVPTTR